MVSPEILLRRKARLAQAQAAQDDLAKALYAETIKDLLSVAAGWDDLLSEERNHYRAMAVAAARWASQGDNAARLNQITVF